MTKYIHTSEGTRLLVNGLALVTSSSTAPDPVPNLGDYYQGGYYVTDQFINGTEYRIIVAPKSAEASLVWDTGTFSLSGVASSTTDGLANTQGLAAFPSVIAASHCRSYTGGGFSDWYLPAIDELVAVHSNRLYLPPGEAWGEDDAPLWSSTEESAENIHCLSSTGGNRYARWKGWPSLTRPIRRVVKT